MHRIARTFTIKRLALALVFIVGALGLTRNQAMRAQALPVPTFYKYEIIARSGAGGLNGFGDNPSINDAGKVAFVGQIAGGEGVFIGDATAAATNITPGFLRTFGRAVQINNTNQVVARDRINGAPPPTRVRIWNGNSTNAFTTIASGGGNILDDYDSVFTHASVNNTGQVVFSALDGALTKLATPAFFGFNELTFTGNAVFRPQIADDGSVVIRSGDQTQPVLQYTNGLTAPIGIGTTANFSVLGMSPGVSDDSRIVGFAGTLTNVSASTPSLGSGIFASVCTVANCLGGGARLLQQIASTAGNPNGRLDLPWEIFVDSNGNGTLEAGEDLPQFTQFEVDSRVAVNATHTMNPQQRAVTVAYVATERRQNRRGLYTSRLNFFGDGVNLFSPTTPGFLTTGVPALVVQEGQTIQDWKTGAQLNGNVQTFSVFDPLNNRDRGDLAFWVQMDTGEQAIVRARQVTILHLEFDPIAHPTPQAQPIAAGLFANLGLMPGWATNFATFVASTGRGFVANTVRNNIVAQVQQMFDRLQLAPGNIGDPSADVNVLVLGATTDNVPLDGPILHVLIGDGPMGAVHCNGVYNPNCGVGGIAPIDIFNQGLDDFAWDKNGNGVLEAAEFGDLNGDGVRDIGEHPKAVLVFVDNIFRIGDYLGAGNAPDGAPEGNFLNSVGGLVPLSQAAGDTPITQADMEHAIASTIAHETGHALGLRHVSNARNDLLMNQNIDPDEMRLAPASHPAGRQVFGNGAVVLPELPGPVVDTENSGARLAFAVGSDETTIALTRAAPSAGVITDHQRTGYRLPALLAPGALGVTQALVGIVRAGMHDAMPEILPLGGGDLATLLDIDLPLAPGDQVFVMGSTTGAGIDVFTVNPASVPAVASITLDNLIIALTDSRVRFDVFDGTGQPIPTPPIELFQIVGNATVDIGGTGGAVAQANLAVALSDAPDPATTGQQVTFTMNVTNLGPDAASNAVATLTLPAGLTLDTAPGCVLGAPVSCTVGAMASGATTSFTITTTATQAGSPSTSASVSGAELDPDPSNNTDSETTLINAADTAGPMVIAATPNGTVAGPVDRFTLIFNEPIAAGTFTAADVVSLTGPSGALAVINVTPVNTTQFDVTFASQAGAGTYTVVIGPDIRDLANNLMNQNQNGTNGEVPGDRFTASVTVDPPDTAGPRVIAAAPSGTVPGPVDRFTLTFNEAVTAGTFTVADVVSLTGPGGALAPTGVTPLSATQFDVTFASQAGAGTYTLVIGPDVRDLANNPMNQNQNGTNGEVPGDRFTTSVTVNPPDTAGPRVIAAAPSGTVPGPVDRFTLTFNEAIAAGTFTAADVVGLTGPLGALAVINVTPLSATQFDVTFASQAGAGTYTLVIGPDIRDLANNPMNQNQNGTNGEVPGDRFTASVTVEPPVARCDADADRDIDMSDLSIILAAQGSLASGPADVRDGNRDGRINIADVRYCQLRLTN